MPLPSSWQYIAIQVFSLLRLLKENGALLAGTQKDNAQNSGLSDHKLRKCVIKYHEQENSWESTFRNGSFVWLRSGVCVPRRPGAAIRSRFVGERFFKAIGLIIAGDYSLNRFPCFINYHHAITLVTFLVLMRMQSQNS